MLAWLCGVAVGLGGCGDDDGGSGGSGGGGSEGGGGTTSTTSSTGTASSPPIADTPLSGRFNGQPWTFGSGAVNASFSEGEPGFYTDLYGEDFGTCGNVPFEQPKLKLDIPKTVGEYDISFDLPVTFLTAPGTSYVASFGHLSVREVTDTDVRGGMYVIFDEDPNFELNGVFEVPICP